MTKTIYLNAENEKYLQEIERETGVSISKQINTLIESARLNKGKPQQVKETTVKQAKKDVKQESTEGLPIWKQKLLEQQANKKAK